MMCSKKKSDVDTTKLSSSMSYCFLQISIGGEMMKDKIIIEFDTLNRPKTCRSFLALCTSSITTRKSSPQQTYRGSEFHRIVPGMCVQGGDFEKFDGTGGFSPLYGHHWEDEHINTNNSNNSSNKNSSNKNNKHDQAGIVSMANPGKKNTNGSQFFITLKPTPHLDANHVVFGRVISGMDTTVQKMADVERDNKNRPVSLQRIVIEDCGLHAQLQQQSTLTDDKKMKKKKKNKKRRRKDDDNDTSGVDDTDNDSDNDDDRRRSRKRHKKKKESRKIDRKKRERKHRRRYQDNDENSSDNDVSSYCSSSTSSSSSSNSYDSDDRKQKRKRYKKKSKGERGKHKRSKKTKK